MNQGNLAHLSHRFYPTAVIRRPWWQMIALGLLMTGCASPPLEKPDSPTETPEPPPVEPTLSPTAAPSATPTLAPTPTDSFPDENLPLAAISYRLPLTIRHLTQNAATLFFELDTPVPARLFLRSSDPAAQTVEVDLDPTQVRHLVTVHDLSPDTVYEIVVAVESGDGILQQPGFMGQQWGPVSVHTASAEGPLRIGIIGDASFGDPVTAALIQQMADSDLDFVLHTGDVVDETEQGVDPFDSYAEKFYTPFAPLLAQMPVYTVIGNHDYDSDIRWEDAPFYSYAFPPFPDPLFPSQENRPQNQYYGFAYQDVQFLMLDSQTFFGQPGREDQQTWLREQLSRPGFRMTIPVFHVSPFTSSSVHPTNSLPIREGWTPLFEGANVPVVFSGHFHQYERFQNNDVTYIVSGGGSSITYAPGEILPESEIFRRQSHFVLLEIDKEELRLTAISVEGEAIDQIRISLP